MFTRVLPDENHLAPSGGDISGNEMPAGGPQAGSAEPPGEPGGAPNVAPDLVSDPHLASITHELRTPLTAISGALDLMQSGALGSVPEAMAGLIAIARSNSGRLLRLIDDILTSEASAANRLVLHREAVDLDQLVREALQANAGLRAGGGAGFQLAQSHPGAWVEGDPARLLRVLANLLSNAVKFSPPAAPVSLSLWAAGGGYRITIRDQGPGIPDAFRARIFQRFARAAETAADIPGSGLGLYITKEIVIQHGGSIWFDSVIGAGTRFHVQLPGLEPVPAGGFTGHSSNVTKTTIQPHKTGLDVNVTHVVARTIE